MNASVFYTQLTSCTSCNYDLFVFPECSSFSKCETCVGSKVLFSSLLQPHASLQFFCTITTLVSSIHSHTVVSLDPTGAKLSPHLVMCWL